MLVLRGGRSVHLLCARGTARQLFLAPAGNGVQWRRLPRPLGVFGRAMISAALVNVFQGFPSSFCCLYMCNRMYVLCPTIFNNGETCGLPWVHV